MTLQYVRIIQFHEDFTTDSTDAADDTPIISDFLGSIRALACGFRRPRRKHLLVLRLTVSVTCHAYR